MSLMLWVLVLVSAYGIVHTYLVFPWQVTRIYKGAKAIETPAEKGSKKQTGRPAEVLNSYKTLPPVAMLMAVHNEESVIAEKLDATLAQDYAGELKLYIGCDNCSDRTWPILQDYVDRFPDRIVASENPTRMGKPNTINRLFEELELEKGTILWLTDASVMPAEDCLRQLVHPTLEDEKLVLVDAQQIHHGLQAAGISRSEDSYISREARIKVAESHVFGHLIGPFGGCYILKADYFSSVPSNYLVDDFFLCMSAYESGGRGVSSPNARAFEAVGQSMQGEFKRKLRIATGNWQNLVRFRSLWWPPTKKLGYAFFSHKILRWISPILAIVMLLSLAVLAFGLSNYWATVLLYSLSAMILVPSVLDVLLSVLSIDLLAFRHWRYFLTMNLALLLGFFRFLKGVRSNVWQPSQRHND